MANKTTKKVNKKPQVKSAPTKQKKSPVKKAPVIIQTENSYGRTILAAFLIIIVCIGAYVGVQLKKNGGKLEAYIASADEKRFKEEYESLNNTEASNGAKYKEISISKDNNIKYISLSEAAKTLDSGSGIIYFGFATCTNCRLVLPTLIETAKEKKISTIYYVNLRPDGKVENDLRDKYALDDRNKPKKTKDADKEYYEILLALAGELDDYVLTTENNKKVNTGEKRLNAPTVVAVKEGVVIATHEGSLEGMSTDESGNIPDLTKEQEELLKKEYEELFDKYLDDGCKDEC